MHGEARQRAAGQHQRGSDVRELCVFVLALAAFVTRAVLTALPADPLAVCSIGHAAGTTDLLICRSCLGGYPSGSVHRQRSPSCKPPSRSACISANTGG